MNTHSIYKKKIKFQPFLCEKVIDAIMKILSEYRMQMTWIARISVEIFCL